MWVMVISSLIEGLPLHLQLSDTPLSGSVPGSCMGMKHMYINLMKSVGIVGDSYNLLVGIIVAQGSKMQTFLFQRKYQFSS